MKINFRNPYLLLGVLALIWGSSFILMKIGLEQYTPNQVASLRICIAGLVFLPFLPWKKLNISKKDLPVLLISGIIGNGLPAFLFTQAQTVISSSLSGALNSLTPFFTLIIGILFVHIKPTKGKIAGVSLGLIGALVLIFNKGIDLSENDFLYSLYAIAATILYGINVNLIKTKLPHLPSLIVAGVPLAGISVIGGFLLFYFNFSPDLSNTAELKSLASIAVLAIFGTAISLALFNELLQQTSAVFASSVTYLIPLVALFWGIYDHESINIYQILGMVIIIAAIYLMRARRFNKI